MLEGIDCGWTLAIEHEHQADFTGCAGVAFVAVDDLVSYHAQMKTERRVGAAFGAELSVAPQLLMFVQFS